MKDIIDYFKNNITVLIIVCLLIIFIHSIIAVLLNNLYESKYKRTTKMAWLPVMNIYLLGSLAVHKIIGFILLLGFFLGIVISIDIKEFDIIHNIISREYIWPYVIIYFAIIGSLLFLCRIKYKRIIREGKNTDNKNIQTIKQENIQEEVKQEEPKQYEEADRIKDIYSYQDKSLNTNNINTNTGLSALRNLNNANNKDNLNNNNNGSSKLSVKEK